MGIDVIVEKNTFIEERKNETDIILSKWKEDVRDALLSVTVDTNPKELIRQIAARILEDYGSANLLDNYDVYDCLLNYWNAKLQDDIYLIKAFGYEAGRDIDYEYAQKKIKDENGETISVDDISKVKSFEGALIPREIIESVYFGDELSNINHLAEASSKLEDEMEDMRNEESGDDGLLKDVLNDKGDSIPKTNLAKRLKELEEKKTSPALDAITQLIELFDEGNEPAMEKLVGEIAELESFDLRNKNGSFGKAKLKAALKTASEKAIVPEIYKDEYEALVAYSAKVSEKDDIDKAWKEARKALDEKVESKYAELSVNDIKELLFEMKWIAKLSEDLHDEVTLVLNMLSAKVIMIAKRYEHTLAELESNTAESRAEVANALERMGYKW